MTESQIIFHVAMLPLLLLWELVVTIASKQGGAEIHRKNEVATRNNLDILRNRAGFKETLHAGCLRLDNRNKILLSSNKVSSIGFI